MIRKKQKTVVEAMPFSEEVSNENAAVNDIEAVAETESVKKISKKAVFKEFFFTRIFKEGTDMFTFVMTAANMLVSVLWVLVYTSLIMYRDSVFSSMEMNTSLNIPAYTVIFSSPLFAVLRVLLYVLPAVYIVWAAAVATAGKRNRKLCTGAFLYACVGLDVLVALFTLFDLAAANLIFGVSA